MPEAVIRFRDIEIVMEERLVKKDGRSVDLTPKVIFSFVRPPGKFIHARNCWIWSGDMILLGIPGRWIRIFRGSAKLDAGDLITTVFGIGYKFEKQAE